jgi:flagellar biosynthesis regulator FlbT
MKEFDKSIILKLNAIVTEQQQTLFALRVPGFYETFENKAVITQMHLLSFMIKLQQIMDSQK